MSERLFVPNEPLEGKYRIISAASGKSDEQGYSTVILTIQRGSNNNKVLEIPFRFLVIEDDIENVTTAFINKVLEIRSSGQFTVPVIRAAKNEELKEIDNFTNGFRPPIRVDEIRATIPEKDWDEQMRRQEK
jgi:hypothetical protein